MARPVTQIAHSEYRFSAVELKWLQFGRLPKCRTIQSKSETNGTSFTFLGFTHVWGKSRLGKNVVRQVTAKNRYARALAAGTALCWGDTRQCFPYHRAPLARE